MNGELEFQFPWVLALLGLLPVYALLRGKVGRLSALVFSSAEIARAAGAQARSAVGRLMFFLRLLVVALTIVALAGPRLAQTKLPVAAFTAFVRNPPPSGMPPYRAQVMTDQELADVWAYIRTFPEPTPARSIPLLSQ